MRMAKYRNHTQQYNQSEADVRLWEAVTSGGLGVSGTLLLVSTLNIGVIVVRRGLRSPNLTARLMGCLAASDILVNVLDTTLSLLTLGGRSCDHAHQRHQVVVVSIIFNILHNLSSFLIASICMERSYWLVSTLHGRAHHPPSSAAKFICIFGIALGLMNIPPWLKLDDMIPGTVGGSGLYLHTSILNWITELSCLGSLVFLTYLLVRFKWVHHGIISPPIAFQLNVSKSVTLLASTNILPIVVSLALIPFWHRECSCIAFCVPILINTKGYALISALRPVVIFIRSKKMRKNLLPCIYPGESPNSQNESEGCNSKVGSSHHTSAANEDGTTAPPCHFNTSVVHYDVANHNICISAQTVAGSMNNLYQVDGTSGAEQQPATQQQPMARSSLLSVSWTNNDQNSRVVPLDLRSSTETLHSMASVTLPGFEHRIDVRLLDNCLGGMAEERIPSATGWNHDDHFLRDQPSRLSIQMHHTTGMSHCCCEPDCSPGTPRRAKSPNPQKQQQRHQAFSCCHWTEHNPTSKVRSKSLRKKGDRQRALSEITRKDISGKGKTLLGSCMESQHSKRSQSLPIICIEQDQAEPNYDGTAGAGLRKASTISSILLPDNQTTLTDSSVASSAMALSNIAMAAKEAIMSADRSGWESPHLPGSISTPSGIPRERFAFNHRNLYHRMSTTSSDAMPESPSSKECSVILWPLARETARQTSHLSMNNAQGDKQRTGQECCCQKSSLCKVDVHNVNMTQVENTTSQSPGLRKKDEGKKTRLLSGKKKTRRLNIKTAHGDGDKQFMGVHENIRPKSSLCTVDTDDDTRIKISDNIRPKSSLGVIRVEESERMRLPEDRSRRPSLILVNSNDSHKNSSGQMSLDAVDVLDEKSGVYIGTVAV